MSQHTPLQTVSRDTIDRVLADPVFRQNVTGFAQARKGGTCKDRR
jgi:hypothetical protein